VQTDEGHPAQGNVGWVAAAVLPEAFPDDALDENQELALARVLQIQEEDLDEERHFVRPPGEAGAGGPAAGNLQGLSERRA
jgi:hypothetical protein